jgi:hypothetical protein
VSTFRPSFYADERNGGPIINCVAASGVNIARAATNGAIPSTDVEVVALRKATGDVIGGQNLQQLQFGLRKRYGFTGPITRTWASFLFSGPAWYVSLGYLHSLPRRCWGQPTDVFHAIAVTGDIAGHVVIIDPLQKPRPVPQRLTIEEFRVYAGSGGYQALRIDEFSEVPHVSVSCRRWQSTWLYDRAGGRWNRHRAFNVRFSGRCTVPVKELVLGEIRRMVRMTSGAAATKGIWVDIDAAHVTYGDAT